MSTRPSVYPEWATTLSADGPLGGNNRVEPSSGDKASGFLYPQQPPREWFNWLLYTNYTWLRYLDEELISGGSSSFAQDNTTTTGLTFGYKKGVFSDQFAKTITETAAGTIALTAASTNWIAYRPGSGIVKVVGAWSGSTLGDVPLWKAVTDGSTITALTDVRSTVDRSIVQFANTARLYGRSTAGAGNGEEITIGSGLQLTSGVLKVAASNSIQTVHAENTTANVASATVSGTYPALTGGTLLASVTITPGSSSNILDFTATIPVVTDASKVRMYAYIIENGGTNVIASHTLRDGDTANGGYLSNSFTLRKRISAGSTSARTYDLYFGHNDTIGLVSCVANSEGGESTLTVSEFSA